MYVGNENVFFYISEETENFVVKTHQEKRDWCQKILSLKKKIVELRTIYAFGHKIEYSLYLI